MPLFLSVSCRSLRPSFRADLRAAASHLLRLSLLSLGVAIDASFLEKLLWSRTGCAESRIDSQVIFCMYYYNNDDIGADEIGPYFVIIIVVAIV